MSADGGSGAQVEHPVETATTVRVRNGRFGPYVQLGDDDDNGGKPRRASLFKDSHLAPDKTDSAFVAKLKADELARRKVKK